MVDSRVAVRIALALLIWGATGCRLEFLLDAPHVPNQLVVGWSEPLVAVAPPLALPGRVDRTHASPTAFDPEVEALVASLGMFEVQRLRTGGASLLQSRSPRTDRELERVAKELARAARYVRYVEANTYFTLAQTPIVDDPVFPSQWSLETLEIAGAWACTQGSREVVVAIVDTGVRPDPDLEDNLWVNPCEDLNHNDKSDPADKNNKDDACVGKAAGNGKVDDFHGWNVAANTGVIYDSVPHGTNVAKIAGSVTDNGLAIAGISPKVSLAVVRADVDGFPTAWGVVAGIGYAVEIGARVINLSLTDLDRQSLRDAVKAAGAVGVILVAAAGYSQFEAGADLGSYGEYPAAYPDPHVIAVTSTTEDDELEPYQNYGATVVELGAPGVNIVLGEVDTKSGTSMAAPHVTGVVALLLAAKPGATVANVREWLAHGDSLPALANKTEWGVRLNARKALEAAVGKSPCSAPLLAPSAPILIE